MRRYDVVSGILLILSIIDFAEFALAAPVLVQEKRQACVDMVHKPKDVITVLGKRGLEDIEKLVGDFFNTGVKPIDSSDAHASSGSAPHGPNPASSTANPGLQGAWGESGDPLPEDQWSYKGDDESHEPTYYTPASSVYGSDHELTEADAHAPQPNPNSGPSADSYFDWNYWFPPPPRPASPTEFGQAQAEHVHQPNPGPSTDSDFDWKYWQNLEDPPSSAPASPKEISLTPMNQLGHVQQPNPVPSTDSYFDWNYWFPPPPRPASPTEFGQAQAEHVQQPNPVPSTDSDFNWKYWQNLEDSPPASPKGISQAHENQAGQVQQPNPVPSTDSDFNWEYWQNLEDSRPASPKEIGQAHGNQAEHVQQPSPVPSTDSGFDWEYWQNLEDSPPPKPGSPGEYPGPMVHPTSPGAGSLTEPEDEVVPGPPSSPYHYQSSSAGIQPTDVRAAIYAAKGKAKESRRVSADDENAAQRELQPGERSLDPGQ
jgi:hypothetical protein